MTPNWPLLKDALAQYRASGQALPLWWRDDDAIKPTPALDKLHGMAEKLGLEVNIAVIPGSAEPALADETRSSACLIPMVHGFQHLNHAPVDQKRSEFGTLRDGAVEDIRAGIARMRDLFGTRFLPVFVPPWNRIAPEHIDALPRAGFVGLSAFGPRKMRWPVPGLVQINTHIDPIDWKGTRDLKDPDQIILDTCANLHARLAADEDGAEPLGYLTHHLVHSAKLWDFSEKFLSTLLDGGAQVQPIAHLLETEL